VLTKGLTTRANFHDGAATVIKEFFLPDLFRLGGELTAESVAPTLEWAKGHRNGKGGLRTALLDA
jgi:hypothetical protein